MRNSDWFSGTLTVLLLALGLSGCAVVLSPEPVGEVAVPIVASEWDGLWTAPEVGMVIRTVDAQAGILDVLFIEGTTTHSNRVFLKASNGWIFASFEDPEMTADPAEILPRPDGPEGGDTATETIGSQATATDHKPYLWMRVLNRDGTLTLWTPHVDRFRRAVQEGKLPGTVGEDSGDPVMLGTLEPPHYQRITEAENGVLMNWEEPAVLVRISKSVGDLAPSPLPEMQEDGEESTD